jgi:ABC-type sugar transport system ATPase subunit
LRLPREVYARPANAFVGGFIGFPSMNFVEGRIQHSNADIRVVLGDQPLALDGSVLRQRPQLAGYEGKEVIVGIRPESLHDAALVPDASPGDLLHGTVELREAIGPELYVHFSAPHVQPADGASIADLPREKGAVGIHQSAGDVQRLRHAITVTLVLDIRPPTGNRNLLHALVALWPSYLATPSRSCSSDRCG